MSGSAVSQASISGWSVGLSDLGSSSSACGRLLTSLSAISPRLAMSTLHSAWGRKRGWLAVKPSAMTPAILSISNQDQIQRFRLFLVVNGAEDKPSRLERGSLACRIDFSGRMCAPQYVIALGRTNGSVNSRACEPAIGLANATVTLIGS